ncbi:MAG: type II restriction endonuclease subunit M [Proteobacteria bacterium]|nr:type II restriction endonuclease subunit M [Pseudomonadota bacterium]
MTTFLRLLNDNDKADALFTASQMLRRGETEPRMFEVTPESFKTVPGAPFAYWVSDKILELFKKLPAFEEEKRTAKQGLATADDFRFVRTWWEVETGTAHWPGFAKGGAFSPYYADIYLAVNWAKDGTEICNFVNIKTGKLNSRPQNTNYYLRPGLTWSLRTTSGLSMRVMPAGCVFAHKGPSSFLNNDEPDETIALLALTNSVAFQFLVELQLAAADAAARSYEVGVIQHTPVPNLPGNQRNQLAVLASHAWSLKRTLDTVTETSHAFQLPAALRPRLGNFDPPAMEAQLARIRAEIDQIAFDLYGFSEADRAAVCQSRPGDPGAHDDPEAEEKKEDIQTEPPVDHQTSLLSWAVGVAFGRFDWRLATGEREAPPEPAPFDPLPAKSPGMLPDGAEPFHAHAGILVDDPGHPHDLTHLVEEVLERVDMPVPNNVRQSLQKDFFAFHLKIYSKSRRKAPIYWPLSTPSGSYTLWIYYPGLTSQTLYSAINDFLEGPQGKLKQVGNELATLRMKGSGRSQEDEKQFENHQTLELELIELRDTLLDIAQNFPPHQDDGVQITAAPLWQLFQHKPWQKVLKATWVQLEKGDFDWAHLAMGYWPARVREKCRTDKSLAIAHGLEELYAPLPVKPKKGGGKKTKEA